MGKQKREQPPTWVRPKLSFREKFSRALLHLLGWAGIAVLYYIAFSFFFDTPMEFAMKTSTRKLEQEYNKLHSRYDSLETVLGNVVDRDRNVFRILFESEPYDFDKETNQQRWEDFDKLLTRDNKQLSQELESRTDKLEKDLALLLRTYETMQQKIMDRGDEADFIPSIQPVINKDLTLLTASFGMRIQPFYKSLAQHNGVDYTIPEGSRVFATADGTVKDVITRQSSSGTTVIIDHGNGYETHYAHLQKAGVSKRQKVRRGDIIALSGNSGLSLAPHLHYEVRLNDMRVNPIHFFFMELSPVQYQQMIRIAQSGMQSFD